MKQPYDCSAKQTNVCNSPLDPTFFQLHTKSGKKDYNDFRIDANEKEIRKSAMIMAIIQS